jgi:signal transduction histidine kinase
MIKKTKAKFVARARLMVLLGEQLITDEIAALSELVKNSYDADAKEVTVTLDNVSDPDIGYIVIKDTGNGMSFQKVKSAWLELGTLSKARDSNLEPKYSESGKRVSLGEKGLGRLSVHKLGLYTELITKRAKLKYETRLILDWSNFENNKGLLKDVPVEIEKRDPIIFSKKGTQITIKLLKRKWNKNMIERVYRSISSLKSPFEKVSDFNIDIQVNDKNAPTITVPDIADLIKDATYIYTGEINGDGRITYNYSFTRPDILDLNHKEFKKIEDIRNPEDFDNDRKPICGSFKVKFYSWDPNTIDLRAVFGDTAIYREMIKPNSGVKVFRDGFRVLPYGNPDNDWLNMDMERVRQFERSLSRNQIIGAIEINSKNNPNLLDKTDREGLIDNEAFRDFRSLVKGSLTHFESKRYPDRRKLKEITGRTREEKTDRTVFTNNMSALLEVVKNQQELNDDSKTKIIQLISETREKLDDIIADKEEPLLVAASIGITYMMPVHEVRRELHESLNILKNILYKENFSLEKINLATSLIKQADSTVGGISKLMQKTSKDETFSLEEAAKDAINLMKYRLIRNNIDYDVEKIESVIAKGSSRLITIILLNLLDNSIYWLLRNKKIERKLKIITGFYEEKCIIIVSDNGSGFSDDINVVTLPFFTRKPDGMGLGLYISDRIAKLNEGKLIILEKDSMPGLYSGANIAIILSPNR